jgi:hypothetical protein
MPAGSGRTTARAEGGKAGAGAETTAGTGRAASGGTGGRPGGRTSPAAAARAAKKELAAVERRLERLRAEAGRATADLAGADPSDWQAVHRLSEHLSDLAQAIAQAEDRWLELAEATG